MTKSRVVFIEKLILDFGDIGDVEASVEGRVESERTMPGGYSATASVTKVTAFLPTNDGRFAEHDVTLVLRSQAKSYVKEKLIDAYWDDVHFAQDDKYGHFDEYMAKIGSAIMGKGDPGGNGAA